ncbi:MAG: glycosyltransferase family 4 protein [Candidatus Aenigmatarchaeota archaeon]
MKILIFNWRDIKNPEHGGAEVFTHEVFKRIAKMGHEVTIFSSEFKGCKKEEFIDSIRIIRSGGRYSVYIKARKYYNNFFSKESYDVIIDEINTLPFFTPSFAKKGEHIIALIHQLAREYWFYETFFPINFIGYHILENSILKKYVEIPTVTVSNSTKNDLLNLGFKKVFIVSEGISFHPLRKIPDKSEKPTIIYLGRLKKAKRVEHVIKAFNIVEKKIPKAKLWIVGSGYLRSHLEKISNKRVTFFGHVNEKKKIDLLSKAWILINPSIREGWGINVIEANACGTPCIAYDVPGLRDSIVDGKTGLLVKENGNIEALANAIIKVLEDEKLRNKLSINALKWARRFSWDKSAREFEKIIKMVSKGNIQKPLP